MTGTIILCKTGDLYQLVDTQQTDREHKKYQIPSCSYIRLLYGYSESKLYYD